MTSWLRQAWPLLVFACTLAGCGGGSASAGNPGGLVGASNAGVGGSTGGTFAPSVSPSCSAAAGTGFTVNGGTPLTGALTGTAAGNDSVQGLGSFAGAYAQSRSNLGAIESIIIDCGAAVVSPASLPSVSSPITNSFTGSDGNSHQLSSAHQAILALAAGSVNNAGYLGFNTSSLSNNMALFPYDGGPAGGVINPPSADVTQYWGEGIYAEVDPVKTQGIAITNGSAVNSAAAITAAVGGSSFANVAGVYAGAWNGNAAVTSFSLDNYGTIAAVYTGSASATAAGVYGRTAGGGQSITNRASGRISASAPYYANAIEANTFFGDVSLALDGSIVATASGSGVGNSAGHGTAIGVDGFVYSGTLSVSTGGTVTASSAGTVNSVATGLTLWNSLGPVSYTNSGTITATPSGAGTTGNAVYMGSNKGVLYFKNTGTCTASGGGWAVGIEQDSGSQDGGADTLTVINEGSIWHQDGLGLFLYASASTPVQKADVTVAASAVIHGGNEGIAAEGYGGDIAIHVYGSVTAGHDYNNAMDLGSGNDTVELIGLPTIVGLMNGQGGSNSLVLKLTGTLEQVNGAVATLGNNIASYPLGQSGSITVSGHTYRWANFSVSGTITP